MEQNETMLSLSVNTENLSLAAHGLSLCNAAADGNCANMLDQQEMILIWTVGGLLISFSFCHFPPTLSLLKTAVPNRNSYLVNSHI